MEKFANFLSNHYTLFILISLLLIFALIGYFVKKKEGTLDDIDQRPEEAIDFSNIQVDNSMSLNQMVNQEQMTNNNQNINPTINQTNSDQIDTL